MPEQHTIEIWKPVVGFEGIYSVSNLGRVRRDASGPGSQPGRILTPHYNSGGYTAVGLRVKGHKRTWCFIHCLVGEAFIGPMPKDKETNHKNGDKADNSLSNIEYVTHLENVRHAIDVLHNYNQGSASPNAKLTEAQVVDIRKQVAAGTKRKAALAREYGVSKVLIGKIVNRAIWSHC